MKKIMIITPVVFLAIALAGHLFFGSMHFLPKGRLLFSSTSPEKEYEIHVYLSEKSLSADAVRCEVKNRATGKTRNIYWEYRKSDAEVEWIEETVVSINGRTLNILTDSYDWRKDDSMY